MGIFNKNKGIDVPKLKLKKIAAIVKPVAPVRESVEEEVEEIEEAEEFEEEVPVVAPRIKVTTKPRSNKQVIEEEEEIHQWEVVREMPTQKVGQYTKDDGTILHFITIEEALSQIMNKLDK